MLKSVQNYSTRAATALGIAFVMAAVSALSMFLLPLAFATPAAEFASAGSGGFYMYSWGNNPSGQLGQGDLVERNIPTRVGTANNWIASATASGGSYAINADGELFAWGAAWNAEQMGQGGVNPGLDSPLRVPTRVGTESNWVQVSGRTTNVLALNDNGELFRWGLAATLGAADIPTQVGTASNWIYISAGNNQAFAINSDGHLYSWGANASGTLGLGHEIAQTTPQRVGDRSDWTRVSSGANFAMGITADGALWAWGSNASGQLGQGNSVASNVPVRVGTSYNWVDARTTNGTSAAINADGELWTWGAPTSGQLGRPSGVGAPANLPARVGTDSNWELVMGGSQQFLAFNTYGELFAWGTNANGQLGVGDNVNRDEPTFVLQASSISRAARGGGIHSLMLFAMVPVSDLHTLTKDLQKPEGTPEMAKSFTFTFERNSFDGNTADANLLPIIPNRVLTLDGSSPSTTADGTTTITGTKDILEGITFDRVGVFSYLVSEVAGSSSTPLPSTMQYSPAVYEMNIYVRQSQEVGASAELYVYRITVTPRIVDNDTQTAGERNDELIFTNTYEPYEPYIPGGSYETTPSVPTTPTVPTPDDDSDETTPTPGNGTDRQPQTGPQTGDISNPVLHLMHMVLAAAIIVVLCYRMRCSSEGLVKK